MIELEDMTESDWVYAYNLDAYLDEAIMALTIPTENRAAGNPFEAQTVNWYRWEKAIKQYEDYLKEVSSSVPKQSPVPDVVSGSESLFSRLKSRWSESSPTTRDSRSSSTTKK